MLPEIVVNLTPKKRGTGVVGNVVQVGVHYEDSIALTVILHVGGGGWVELAFSASEWAAFRAFVDTEMLFFKSVKQEE